MRKQFSELSRSGKCKRLKHLRFSKDRNICQGTPMTSDAAHGDIPVALSPDQRSSYSEEMDIIPALSTELIGTLEDERNGCDDVNEIIEDIICQSRKENLIKNTIEDDKFVDDRSSMSDCEDDSENSTDSNSDLNSSESDEDFDETEEEGINFDYNNVELEENPTDHGIRFRSQKNNSSPMEENINYYDYFYKKPVYKGSPITVGESMMIMMSLILKHKISKSCVEDIFRAFTMHCIPCELQNLNLYYFKRFFEHGKSVKNVYFCSECGTSLQKKIRVCNHCSSTEEPRYFTTLSIVHQIKEILGRKKNYDFIQARRIPENTFQNCFQDLSDGCIYKNQAKYFSDPGALSLTWNTDGVPVFKSSNISIWPFYLRINELPFNDRIRQENTILAGLWFGPDKPSPNLFVSSFEVELKSLYEGINIKVASTGEHMFVRAIVLCGTCDLPAKSSFLNFKQYNSMFGCTTCEIATEEIKIPSQKSIRVYRYSSTLTYRSLDQTLQYAKDAYQLRINPRVPKHVDNVNGVKGPSALHNIMPDYVLGTGIDSMHALYEGVMKKLIYLWIDSSFSNNPFSLRPVLNVIDKKLLEIQPPKYIHRMPRELSKYKSWKASELKCWCFYYSPVILSTIMRKEYFNHYMLFVTAAYLLNKDKITVNEVVCASIFLNRFVEDFEVLYSIKYCSINIHQLLHLANDVIKFGPLWINSCFSFEDINGKLVKTVSGTTNVETQIINAHWQYLKFTTKSTELPEGEIRNFIEQHKKQVKICQTYENYQIVGVYKKYDAAKDKSLKKILSNIDASESSVRIYFRLLKDSLLYVSTLYSRPLKTNSSFAMLTSEGYEFARILYFIKLTNCECQNDLCLCEGRHFAIINPISINANLGFFFYHHEIKIPYLFDCTVADDKIVAIPLEKLINVCFCIKNDKKLFLGCRINSHERE